MYREYTHVHTLHTHTPILYIYKDIDIRFHIVHLPLTYTHCEGYSVCSPIMAEQILHRLEDVPALLLLPWRGCRRASLPDSRELPEEVLLRELGIRLAQMALALLEPRQAGWCGAPKPIRKPVFVGLRHLTTVVITTEIYIDICKPWIKFWTNLANNGAPPCRLTGWWVGCSCGCLNGRTSSHL